MHQRSLVNAVNHASIFQGLLNVFKGDGFASQRWHQADLHGHLVGCDLHLNAGIAPLGHLHHKRCLRSVALGRSRCDGVFAEQALTKPGLIQ